MKRLVKLIIYISMFNTSIFGQFSLSSFEEFLQEHFPWGYPFFSMNLTMPVMTTKGLVQGKLLPTVDDVLHVFWASNLNQPLDLMSDIGIRRTRMVKMWTNFAKYGNPTPRDLDRVLSLNWPNTDSERTYLEIDNDYTMEKQPVDDFVKYLQRVMEPLLGEQNGCRA
ncbi:pyrethroid hydrolase Ces2a-like [Cotesia typhae]|uniref:pyrethroid hydrolase Ces2a-like n=1 Tax=Cotesia typhae TaxID=2053667 RepID=UPI003D687603